MQFVYPLKYSSKSTNYLMMTGLVVHPLTLYVCARDYMYVILVNLSFVAKTTSTHNLSASNTLNKLGKKAKYCMISTKSFRPYFYQASL